MANNISRAKRCMKRRVLAFDNIATVHHQRNTGIQYSHSFGIHKNNKKNASYCKDLWTVKKLLTCLRYVDFRRVLQINEVRWAGYL